ncbi:MAG: hypothetical protein NVS3B20_13530 [Polyangiales bacterium]
MSSDPAAHTAESLKCPVAQAVAGGTAIIGSAVATAFHVKTTVPVSTYDIVPYGGGHSYIPGAELVLPTSAWGTNYIAMVPTQESPFAARLGESGPQWGQIIAAQAGTTIKIAPTSTLPAAGSIPSIAAGTAASFTLNADEYVQWGKSGNLTGSIISSDKPVAFIGGSDTLCVRSATSTGSYCDAAHQQIPPVPALGSEYVAAPYETRRADMMPESIPYRLVGAVNGTTLSFDPAVAGAPATLKLGEFVDFETPLAFKVSSQDKDHPFAVAQMMTGGLLNTPSRDGVTPGNVGKLGDAEHVMVLPPAQFLTKYVFFTDPTYGTTNLVATRIKGKSGFKDVTVDCLGKLSGWKPVDAAGSYEVATVDLVRSAKGVGSCTNGLHVASSDGAFGLTVWGLDSYASYAYPAGGNVESINSVVVPPLPK